MKSIFQFLIIFSFTIYYLSNCASITPPGGGPRDTIPPILVQSIPENKSLNFSGKTVKLTYDEYLKVENLTKQLIITPILKEEYDFKIKKHSIELIFEEPFADTTTFTFNFQEAIKDITESNVTLDNVLAFSTGDYIDSLHITGKVLDLFTKKPLKEAVICLYKTNDTLDIFNSPPVYLTKSNKEGKFIIENIKNGIYRIYAYHDTNSNLICDVPKEIFGFKSDSIVLNSNLDSILMKVQYLNMLELVLQRDGSSGRYYEVKTNKPIVSYTVNPINASDTIYSNFGEDKKTIRFYNNIGFNDSIPFIITATDSLDQFIQDTLYMKFRETKRKKDFFSISFTPKNNSDIEEHFKGVFKFNKPLKKILFDSIFFEYDSATFQYIDDALFTKPQKLTDKIEFQIDLFMADYIESLAKTDTAASGRQEPGNRQKAGAKTGTKQNIKFKLKFHAKKGAFISIENDSTEAFVNKYEPLRTENFGIIKGKIISDHSSYTIQLLNTQYVVISEIKNEQLYIFNKVDPGQYKIRVLVDNNGNGKWDPGNIFDNIEPEDVYYFPESISIRSNWELTDIDMSF